MLFWKKKQYYSFEKVVLTFCGHHLSHYPWGKVHRHPNTAGRFGETFSPCTAAPGNSRRDKTQTLEISSSWPRLNAQGEVKTQLPVTNSRGTMDVETALWTPECSWFWITLIRHWQLGPPHSRLPRRASDSAWGLSQTVFFPSCGLCSPSESQHQRGRSVASPAVSLSGTVCAWTDAQGKLIPSGESIAYRWRR